jgi:hypothetical protein
MITNGGQATYPIIESIDRVGNDNRRVYHHRGYILEDNVCNVVFHRVIPCHDDTRVENGENGEKGGNVNANLL